MIVLFQVKVKYFVELDLFFYFIPIFAILFIFTGFWMFLYQGYNKIYEKDKYFIILFNLLIFNVNAVLIYLKISGIFNLLTWFNILGIFSLVQSFNFLYFSLQDIKSNGKNGSSLSSSNEVESWENYITAMDIIMNISVILFFLLLGFYFDNHLDDTRKVALFILTWMFSIFMIIKFVYRNLKIKNYFEWKKTVTV